MTRHERPCPAFIARAFAVPSEGCSRHGCKWRHHCLVSRHTRRNKRCGRFRRVRYYDTVTTSRPALHLHGITAHILQHIYYSTYITAHILQHIHYSTYTTAHILQHIYYSTYITAHILQHIAIYILSFSVIYS
jgi:hypothetical protein